MSRLAESAHEELRFGRCEPLFEIARGGMARVYAARSTGEAGFSRVVAVKHMLAELDDPAFVDLFLDEARVAAAVHSPFVVQTFDLGRASDGRPYLVMELVVGVSLGRVMFELARQERPMPLGIAVRVVGDAARGLHHAHETTGADGAPLGIVHRDVSPQNVLVDEHGRVRIADFGIARALERRGVTSPGQRRGKASYMSPEQWRGRAIDRRSDLFSLGVVAWEAIAGRPLLSPDAERDTAIAELREVRPDVPAALSAVVARSLAREPSRRHRTAEELGAAIEASGVAPASEDELAAFVRELCGDTLERLRHPERHRPAGAPGDGRPRAVPEVPAPPSTPGTVPVSPRLPSRPGRWRVAALAAAAVALLALAGFAVARSLSAGPADPSVDGTSAAQGPPPAAAPRRAQTTEPETGPEPPPSERAPGTDDPVAESDAPTDGPRTRTRPREAGAASPAAPAAGAARETGAASPAAPAAGEPEPVVDERHGLPFGLAEFPSSSGPTEP